MIRYYSSIPLTNTRMQVRDRTLELATEKQLGIFKARMLDIVHDHRTRTDKIHPSAVATASLRKQEAEKDIVPKTLAPSFALETASKVGTASLEIRAVAGGHADASTAIFKPSAATSRASTATVDGDDESLQADLSLQHFPYMSTKTLYTIPFVLACFIGIFEVLMISDTFICI